MAAQEGARLEQRYLTWMALVAVPLLALVAGLAIAQYRTQRAAILTELGQAQREHRIELDTRIKPARDHVASLREMAQARLSDGALLEPSPLRPRLKPTAIRTAQGVMDGFTLDGPSDAPDVAQSGNVLATADGLAAPVPGELDMALDLFEVMRLQHLVTPYLHWSYYFAASSDFVAIYPSRPSGELLSSATAADLRGAIQEWLDYDVFLLGTPGRNPDRTSYWTAAYEDAARAGWMVSHAAPVYAKGKFFGVVGTDILLSVLDETLDQFPNAAGTSYVVDEAGNVLAASGGPAPGHPDGSVAPLATYLPPDVAERSRQLLQTGPDFQMVGDLEVRTEALQNAPWRLLLLVPERELIALLMPRFVPYAIIILALLMALVITHLVLRWQFIRPAIRLVDHIRRSGEGQSGDTAKLPAPWQPWATAVTRSFDRERALRERLKSSEARFLAAADSMPDGLLITDAEDRIRFYNRRYPEHLVVALREVLALGKRFDEWIREGMAIGPVYHPDMGADFPQRRLAIRARGDSDHEHHLADGRWVRLREQRMADGGLVLVSTDISARKEAELALQESQARYRAIVEDQTELVARFDTGFRMVFCNEASARILGRTPAEAIGADFFESVPAEDRAKLRAELLALTPERSVMASEGYKILPDGSTRWYLWTNRALFDEAGQLLGFQTVGSDITERRRTEEELVRQREALHQAEKLGALGSLLAGVAHELNNPLSIVVGHAEMLRDQAPDDRTRARSEKIHAAAERCAKIVRTFLAMARSEPRKPQPVQMNDTVSAALGIVGYALRSGDVTVETHLAPDLPPVWGDPDQLHQVVANLLVNAQQAVQDIAPPRIVSVTTRPSAERVELEVADNGPGIPPAIRARVFEPFFTTKPVGIGTGIGLSVSRGIVMAHQGTMAIVDRPGAGAVILVSLPRAPMPARSPDREDIQPPSRPGTRILIADDEEDILEMLAETLERDGHEVVAVKSGREALERLDGQAFDLILSDLRMPDLDGAAFLRAIEERRPELVDRLILMTGDVLGARLSGPFASGDVPILEKPVQRDVLRKAVAARLAAAGAEAAGESDRARGS